MGRPEPSRGRESQGVDQGAVRSSHELQQLTPGFLLTADPRCSKLHPPKDLCMWACWKEVFTDGVCELTRVTGILLSGSGGRGHGVPSQTPRGEF